MTSRSRTPHKIREIERTVLPNGVRVVTERMPHVRSVSVGVWIGTGSREESLEETGISHFIEHMLFKGTKNQSAEQIARSVDSIGGGLDAFTSKELVSYNVKVLDEHLPRAFGIVSDLVRHPLFEKSDIEKEKGVILEELKMDVDNPEYLIHEIFASNFWKGHSLGRPILGTRQTIRSFDRDSVERYYRRYYTPENILITAAGSLTHKKLVQLSEDHFGALKTHPMPKADGRPQAHAPLVFREKDSLEQVHLYLGVPSIAMPHRDRFACYILNAILGGGMSSRLFQNIREKQALAYTVYSELTMYHDAGCMMVYAGTSPKSAGKVIDSIVHEMREITDHLVTPEELRRAKDHLKGSFVLGLESTSSRMGNLARQELYFKRFFSLNEMLESIENVTADQVQKLAQQFFDPKQTAVAMLGRLEGFRVRRQDLKRQATPATVRMRFLLKIALLLALAVTAWGIDTKKLQATGYVNDFAGVLDASGKQTLEEYCANLEHVTGVQMAIVLVNTLDDEPVEDVANRLFREWGIGKKGKDEGILILLAVKDRKSRAEIGYGIEPIINDGAAGGILRQIRPILQQGNYSGALLAAAQQMGTTIAQSKGVELGGPEPLRVNGRQVRQPSIPFPLILLGLFFLLWLLGRGGRGGSGTGFLTGMILGNMMGGRGGGWGGGGFGGGGGGGGGFGGFGGGDSGGGGASGGW